MTTRIRFLVAFLVVQGQYRFRISLSLNTPQKHESNYENYLRCVCYYVSVLLALLACLDLWDSHLSSSLLTKYGVCMLSGGKSKRTVDVNCFAAEKTYSEISEELERNDRRKDLWAKALQKSRGDEYKANTLYIQYRAQFIRDEAETAKELSRESSATIIQSYITKLEIPDPGKKKQLQIIPSHSISKKYREKKCYKCGGKVPLEVKPCPGCHCNSFVFCR